ncbi:MAG: hemerythrin domain-containing protein, partial [Rhizobacter sp.]|nr:hemerythrin domain-containing protein [Rhizobacter sp.]
MSASANERPADVSSDSPDVDAIDLLKRDHGELATLFKSYGSLIEAHAQPDERRALSTQICGMVVVHTMIEEEIFYPAARKAGVDATLLDEAVVEHRAAKDLIFQIGESRASDRDYDARLTVLGEYITH